MQKNPPRRRCGCLLFLLAFILFLYFAFSEELHTVTYTVESPKITAPVRLVLLSDLHSCTYGENQSELLAAIGKADPDAICLVGDIFDDEASHKGALALLDGIADAWPCYFATGNHEHWSDEYTVFKGLLSAYGITVLSGDTLTLTVGEQTLLLGGIDDPTGFHTQGDADVPDKETWHGQLALANAAAAASPDYSILLSHRPEKITEYRNSAFDLVLTGHAHGGQVRIPLLLPNGVFSPGEGYRPTYTGGVHVLGDTSLVISRGLCKNELPRVFNPPELVVIDLVPAA